MDHETSLLLNPDRTKPREFSCLTKLNLHTTVQVEKHKTTSALIWVRVIFSVINNSDCRHVWGVSILCVCSTIKANCLFTAE